jgi:hypothetical protein
MTVVVIFYPVTRQVQFATNFKFDGSDTNHCDRNKASRCCVGAVTEQKWFNRWTSFWVGDEPQHKTSGASFKYQARYRIVQATPHNLFVLLLEVRSSVSTVFDYRVDDLGSIPGRGKGFFL